MGGKRAASLFSSFCSNVARKVARLLLPVFPYLKSCSSFIVSDRENAKFVPLTLCPRGIGTPNSGMGEEEGKGKGIRIAIVGFYEGSPP